MKFGFGAINLRSSRLKQRRRRQRNLIIAGVVTLFIALVIGLIALSRASFITISEVSVTGNATITQETVVATVNKHLTGHYLWFFPKRNYFLYPKEAIKIDLFEQLATAKEIKIQRKNFHSISVELEERENNALWCLSESKCFFLDVSGYVFAEAPTFSHDVYHKYYGGISDDEPVGKQYLSSEKFTALESFITALSSLGLNPAVTHATDSDEYEIVLESGSRIMLNQEKDFIDTFTNLEALWNNQDFQTELEGKTLEYLDLRFGNKVFYKLN